MIDIELLLVAKTFDLLKKKHNSKNKYEKKGINKQIHEIRGLLKASRFFKNNTCELATNLNNMHSEFNGIAKKDWTRKPMPQIIDDYGFYESKKNFDYYENCTYEAENYESIKASNKRKSDNDTDSDTDSENDNNSENPTDNEAMDQLKKMFPLKKAITNNHDKKTPDENGMPWIHLKKRITN